MRQPVKVGVVMSYSGQFADPGAQIDNGIKLYMKQNGDTVAGKKIEIIGDDEITGTRVIKFGEIRVDGTTEFWRTFRFTVDGRTFDPERVDQRVRLGAVEEWTIINDQPQDPEDHVFHIHTNDMLLTKINGEPLAEPIWLDTAILPRNGSITFRSRFVDFTGKFMLHCHMMNHEDLGMMQVVEVYADDE